MKKKLSFMLSLLAAAAMAVTLEETDKAFIVKNDNYTANFMKAQGGAAYPENHWSGLQCPEYFRLPSHLHQWGT